MTDLSVSQNLTAYTPVNKVRFVTAASLFDGHDASINIMRRILMSQGAEVIHLGHNRSVEEIVTAALQEDAQVGAACSCDRCCSSAHGLYRLCVCSCRVRWPCFCL